MVAAFVPSVGSAPPNNAPVVDLNGVTVGVDISQSYTGGDPTLPLCSAALVSDDDDDPLGIMTIVGADFTADDEIIKLGATPVEFAVDTNLSTTVTAGSTTFAVAYTTADTTFVITKNGGGTAAVSEWQTLLRTLSYVNNTLPATAGDRLLDIVVNDGVDDSVTATVTLSVAPGANHAPVVDLNGAIAGINITAQFSVGDSATLLCPDATLTDIDDTVMSSITFVGTTFGADGADEAIEFGAAAFPANADSSDTLVVGATTFALAYTTATKTLVATKNGGGTFAIADGESLIQLLAYANAAQPATMTNRVFTVVANDGNDDSTAATLTVTMHYPGELSARTALTLPTEAIEWAFMAYLDPAIDLDADGITLVDATGNAEVATLSASACPDFDGTGDYVSVANTVSFHDQDWTISGECIFDSVTGTRTIISQLDGSGTGRNWLANVGGTWCTFLPSGTQQNFAGLDAATTATRYVWSMVKSGTSFTLTVNGVASSALTITMGSATGNIRIGATKTPNNYFDGKIYNVKLTHASGFHLPMCEGSGATSYDVSGNAKHGTHTGTTWSTQDNYHHGYQYGAEIFDDDATGLIYIVVPHATTGVKITSPTISGYSVRADNDKGQLFTGLTTTVTLPDASTWNAGDGAQTTPLWHAGETGGPYSQFYSFVPVLLAPAVLNPGPRYVGRSQTINNITLTNTGGDGTFALTSGTLPAGLSGNQVGQTYVISGTVGGSGAATHTLTYECSNATGDVSVTFTIDVRSTYTEISSSDTFPYYCSTVNGLYLLTEDITVPGTAIHAHVSGVVIDLQGHSITYDDDVQPTLTGGDFVTEAHWNYAGDFSHNSSASFLDREVWPDTGTASCQVAIPTASADVSIDAANTVALVDGEWYTLCFHVDWSDQTIVANTAEFSVELSNGTYTYAATKAGKTFRSMQLTYVTFQAEATDDFTVTLRVQGMDAEPAATVHFSNVRLLRTGVHGIAFGIKSSDQELGTDITQYGSSGQQGGTVTTSVPGSVIEQSSNSWGSHAVYGHGWETGRIYGCDSDSTSITLISKGPQSRPIGIGYAVSAAGSDITVDCQADSLTSRDNNTCSAIGYANLGGTWNNIRIVNALHTGIAGTENGLTITNCVVENAETYYTNDFMFYGYALNGATYSGNTITLGTGTKSGRGIYCRTSDPATNPTMVENNNVITQQLLRNQEYGGYQFFGAYSFQTEKFDNLTVQNNVFQIVGETDGAAMKLGTDGQSNDRGTFTDNDLSAITSSTTEVMSCARVGLADTTNVEISGGTWESNVRWLNTKGDLSLLPFENIHWKKVTTGGVSFYPWGAQDDGDPPTNLVVLNPTYEDAGSKSAMDAPIRNENNTATLAGSSWSVQNDHVITFVESDGTTPVTSLAVTIDNAQGTEVVSDTTDGSGELAARLTEYSYSGATKTAYNRHLVTTAEPSYHHVTFDETNRELTINVAHGEPHLTAPAAYNWTVADVISEDLSTQNDGATGTYAVQSGSLPTGLSLATDGELTGTISGSAGSFAPVIRCTGTYGYSEMTLDITVATNVTRPSVRASNSAYTESGTSVTVTTPGQSGDLLIAILHSGVRTASTPSGWTQLFKTDYNSLGSPELAAYYKTHSGGGEPGTHALAVTGGSDTLYGIILALQDCDTATPVYALNSTQASAAGINAPSVSVADDGSLVIRAAQKHTNVALSSTPANHTLVLDGTETTDWLVVLTAPADAGTEAAVTITATGSGRGVATSIVIPPV